MALFKVFKGVKSSLPSLSSSQDGYCYFTTDDGMFYIDYKNANGVLERKSLNANDAKTLLGASLETTLTENDKKVPTSKAVLTKIGEVEASVAAINSALNGKQAKITGAATTITGSNLTANRALVSNSSGKVAVSDVTSTELGYLDGVTSAIQTQLNAKAALASPTFTGTPKAPTAAAGTNTTQVATTAFVTSAVSSIKSNRNAVTLAAASWSGTAAPYTYAVTISGHANTTDLVELMVGDSMTAAQITALQAANIVKAEWTANTTLTLYAYGTKPTVDAPVNIVVRKDI